MHTFLCNALGFFCFFFQYYELSIYQSPIQHHHCTQYKTAKRNLCHTYSPRHPIPHLHTKLWGSLSKVLQRKVSVMYGELTVLSFLMGFYYLVDRILWGCYSDMRLIIFFFSGKISITIMCLNIDMFPLEQYVNVPLSLFSGEANPLWD